MSRLEENPYKTTTRKRMIGTGYRPETSYVYYSGYSTTPKAGYELGPEMCDAQITVSEGHSQWNHFKDFKGIRPDIGGDFSTTRWSPIVDKTIYFSSFVDSRGRLWQCEGPVIPSVYARYDIAHKGWGYITKDTPWGNLEGYFPTLSSTDNELLAFGTSAIAKVRPDISPTSVTQFLVELKRDGIPFRETLSKRRLQKIVREFNRHGATQTSAKESSNFFLENQFGLKPFISDLQSFVKQADHGVSVLDNLIANSGKLIRRRYSFPDENFTTTRTGHSSPKPFTFRHTPDVGSTGEYFDLRDGDAPRYASDWDVHTSRRTWFSGAFMVYMPKDMEPVSRLKSVVDHLRWDWGVDLDISTMWNLAPWSWLLDWDVNLGDVITNVSKWSQDAVVLHHGYIMQETKTRYMSYPEGHFIDQATFPSTILPSQGILVHKKRRIRATPYGFGKTFGSLTTNQKGILAAIGITRF